MLQELWSLAGIEPVGGRRPAEIAHRLVERAEAAKAGRLDPAQADKVRAFLAVSDRPEAAFDAIASLAGPNDGALKAAIAGWRSRLSGTGRPRRAPGPHDPGRRLRPGLRLLRRLSVRGALRSTGRRAADRRRRPATTACP
ncbi:hypothetical protein ACRAWD_23905 [Caulobacter segnis]